MPRVALVTGAGTGIGRGVAIALARAGYSVVLAGRRRDMLEETASQAAAIGAATLVMPTDISDGPAVEAMFARTQETFGRLDLLFNNAGIAARGVPIEELTIDEWRAVVDVNLTGTFLCTQAAVRLMKKSAAARRTDHQQRFDLRARAAAELRAVHGDQARHHRTDQIDGSRRPCARYRVRTDRHRECRHGAGGQDGQRRPSG